jgi:transposase
MIDKETGALLERRRFDTSLRSLAGTLLELGRLGEIHVHMEASSLAGWVRGVLKEIVKRIVISHPKSNAWIGKDPLKNDRIDALKLAELLRMQRYREVYYPDDDDRIDFKRLVQHYDDLARGQGQLKVMIKDRLRAQGIILKDSSPFTRQGKVRAITQVKNETAAQMIRQLYAMLEAQTKVRQAALQMLRVQSAKYPEVAQFEEVPGIALILACRFSAYVQTPHRFADKQKLWRYSRLGIAWRESDGKPLNHQALDRNGCGALKDLSRKAFAGAMKSKEENAFKRAYASTLQRTGDKVHARLTVQRKIIATLWAMWRKGESYKDNYAG